MTSLEQSVIDTVAERLSEGDLSETIVEALTNAFSAGRLPSPDEMFSVIKAETGEPSA